MVIDTSALAAIMFDEPERAAFVREIARATGEPLLFKGQDFARTDVASAV